MPEGDSVVRTARALDRALAGQVLVASDFRVPALATLDLSGAICLRTDTHGKHLLTRFRRGDEQVTVHSHLGMDGQWRVLHPGRRAPVPAHLVRAVWETGAATVIGTELKELRVVTPAAEAALLAVLGPDLLAEPWQPGAAVAALRDAAGRPAAEALLDQQVVAGLGTVLVSEVLFLLGVAPTAPLGTADPVRLVTLARQVMVASVRQGHRTTTGNSRRGQGYWVYGRGGRPCRRCTTPVRGTAVGPPARTRTVWSCPGCQPAPGP